MAKELARRLANKMMVERHNQQVNEYWKQQEAKKIAEDTAKANETRKQLGVYDKVMNPGLSSRELIQGIERTQTREAEAEAKRQYEGYKQSEQRKTDWDKAIRDAISEMPTAGSGLDLELGKLPQKTINQTEMEKGVAANYYQQNRKATEDRHMMENDVAEVEAMPPEDRKLLETYAYGRNEWFDHQRIADSISARTELEKKYGKQKVQELAESWQRYQNAVSAEKNIQQTQEGAGSGFLAGAAHSAASVAANTLGSLTAPFGYLQEAVGRTGRYQTLDPNNPGAMPGQYASAVRGAVSEDMGTAGKVLYQGTMGALDNLARLAVGGGTKIGTLGLAALGSFGSTLSEASAQGATPGQAAAKAVLSAGIEAATEKLPLDELFKAGKSGYKGAAAAFKQALKQGGIEAAEEEISLLGNVLTDALVMREKSGYNQQIAELVANGMSYAQAKTRADRELWDEAVNTALSSWVSGGVMSGAQSAGQYMGQQLAQREQMRSELASQIQGMMARENTDVEGRPMPANREYLDFLEERQINEYRREGMGDLIANAVRYAPQGAGKGFEAMGAASKGFTGKEAYNELLTDENVQPVRPWAVREMEVPKTDKDGRRVTEFAANAAGAAATSDAVADSLAQLIGEGAMSFDSRSKQQSINNAVSELEKRPISEVVGEISERVSQGTIKDGDIEKALVAYNLLSNDGTTDGQARAAAMLPMLGKMANISGRNLNMFGILKKLDPNMQVQAVQDDIDRTIKELNKERSGGSVIEGEQMRINEDLAEVFKEAETEEEKAKALDDIYKDIASRIKPTVWEMWDAWRNLAMLGNFKTHIRNVLGSGAFRPSVNAKRVVGAALERVFVDQENRTKALIGTSAQDKALLAWAKQDAKNENIQKMMQYSGTTGNEARSAIEEQRRYLPGKLENVRRFNMEKMEQADMAWKKREYALALAGFLKARGYTAKQAAMDIMTPGGVPTEVMDEARSYAAKEAMKATFNDRNRFSDAVARLRVKGNKPWDRAANMVLKGILPFTRTPANVLVRAVEYSPAGLAEGFRQLAQDVKTGDATVADGLDKIASGLTGTGAMVLGAALAYGLIPGVKLIGRLDEEDREEDPNAIEYSLKIGDKYYGISWLAPGAIPLLIGANFYQSIQDKEEITDGWDVLSALGGTVADTLDPLLELSMLSSLNDLVETVRYEDSPGEMALAAVTNAATNYFTQGLPTLFGQIEQATEKTKSSVYSNADNPMQRSFERTVGKATQRLPGIDLYQTERLDAEGNPVENGPWYQRAFDALINPFSHSESGTTPVTKELSRLGVTAPTVSKTVTYTDDQGIKREDYRLSAEEFSNMQRIQLGNSSRIMGEMLESSEYEKLPDDLKEKALEYVKDYARELARGEVLPGYDGLESWMEGIEGDEAGAIIRKVAAAEMTDAFSTITQAWREGYADDSEAREGLQNAFSVFDSLTPEMQETIAEDAGGQLSYYLEAKKAGMDTATFVDLYRKYWDIDQSEKTTSEKAQAWSYALERAYESRTITKGQRDALKDEMVYMQMFPAETEKFDQLTEGGLSADDAQDLGWLIQGLKIQDGYKEVRDIQKAEAIGNMSGLSEADRIAALRIYGTNAQDENLDQMLEMGYTSKDYLNAWKLIAEEKEKGGTGTKRRTINALAQMYGVSTAKATEIYEVWYPKGK